MKKLVIGAIVGGIILFFCQFLSWGLLGWHTDTQQYSPNQEKVLQFLDENLEEGFYYMPTTPHGSTSAETEKLMNESIGKPWAQVYFHKNLSINMGMNMTRGLLVDIFAIGLLCWLLLKMHHPSFTDILFSSIAVGLIAFITNTYTGSIWFEFPTKVDLFDSFFSFGLVGMWLAWWIRR